MFLTVYIFTLGDWTSGSTSSWQWEDWGVLGSAWTDREGSREKTWWLGERLLLLEADRGKVERRPSLSLLDRGWEMAAGQWEISGLENGEAGSWDSLEVMAGTLMPILMSMAPL